MPEQLVGTVRGWVTCKTLTLTVPRHLREEYGFKKGDHFAVKIDEQKRIIYEKIPNGRGTATNEDPAHWPPHNPMSEVSG